VWHSCRRKDHKIVWPIERIIAIAEKAVDVDVRARLHDELGKGRLDPTSTQFARDLGISPHDDGLQYDDTASMTKTNRALDDAVRDHSAL
jgi:hypothetical protein